MRRLACALVTGLALAAAAASAGPDPAEQASWAQRLGDAREAVEQAQARRSAAEDAYDEMRHRQYPRGEARAAVEAERTAARDAVTDAQQKLDALLDEARLAGVPPGWLRAPDASPAAPDAPAAEAPGRTNLPHGPPGKRD